MTDTQSLSGHRRTSINETAEIERLAIALAQSEERHNRIVDSSPDVIFRLRLHPDVGFDYISKAAERVFGIPLEDLRTGDRQLIMGLLADDMERERVDDLLAGRTFNSTQLRRWRRPDGEEIWTEQHVTAVYDDSGRIVAVEGVARDVTDRQRAIDAVHTVEEQQRRLIEAIPDLLLKLDESGTFVDHVPTASRQPARAFLGKRIDELAPPENYPAARVALRKALAGEPDAFRCAIDLWGDERNYEIRMVPTGTGELLAFLRDVTGEVWAAAEEERRKSRDKLEGVVEQQIGIRNPHHLTFREFAVLHLVAQGSSDKEIAHELGIALSTVNKHVSNILGKMGAASRTEAGVRAVQEGLVATHD